LPKARDSSSPRCFSIAAFAAAVLIERDFSIFTRSQG